MQPMTYKDTINIGEGSRSVMIQLNRIRINRVK